MVHTEYNSTTHPIVRLEDDWNDHERTAHENVASYLIRKNGSYYEAIKGSTNTGAGTVVYGGQNNEGATDGTNAAAVINAAITATQGGTPDESGGNVHIKAGNYTLNSTVTVKERVILSGEGWYTKLLPAAGVTALTLNNTENYITLRDFRVEGAAGACTGLTSTVNGYLTIENVDFDDISGYAINAGWLADADIRNVKVISCGKVAGSLEAVYIDHATDCHFFDFRVISWYYKAMTVATHADNLFIGCQWHGNNAAWHEGVTMGPTGDQDKYLGCVFSWCENQLELDTSSVNVILGCTFQEDNSTYPISIDGSDNEIAHCIFNGSDPTVVGGANNRFFNNFGYTAVSGITRTIFVPITYSDAALGALGNVTGAVLPDGSTKYGYGAFTVPADFSSLYNVYAVMIASGVSGHPVLDCYADFGADTETYTTHSTHSGGFLPALTSNKWARLWVDGATLLASAAANDYVGLNIKRTGGDGSDDLGGNLIVTGFLIYYYPIV